MSEETALLSGLSSPSVMYASHFMTEPPPSLRDRSPVEKIAKLNPPPSPNRTESCRRGKQSENAGCQTGPRRHEESQQEAPTFRTDLGSMQQRRAVQASRWIELQRLQHPINFIVQDVHNVLDRRQRSISIPTTSSACRPESASLFKIWTLWCAAAPRIPRRASNQQLNNAQQVRIRGANSQGSSDPGHSISGGTRQTWTRFALGLLCSATCSATERRKIGQGTSPSPTAPPRVKERVQ